MAALEIIEIDLSEPTDRVDLVHELEHRGLNAAAAVDRDSVLVAVPRPSHVGAPALLEPIVAPDALSPRKAL